MSQDLNSMTYMPTYECVYCKKTVLSIKLKELKKHIQKIHPTEVIVVRDCIAYRQKQASKIYLCYCLGCKFSATDYKQYLAHTIAHKGGILYGCHICNWAAQDKKDFKYHVKRKGVEHSLLETKVFMKDDGTIVKVDV